MKKVLITGGAGFIGYHLAIKLLESDYDIDLLDNFSRGVSDPQLHDLVASKKINLILQKGGLKFMEIQKKPV